MFYWLYCLLQGWLVLHYFFDTHYFMRTFIHGFIARFFSKRIKFVESCTIYGICLTTDVDFAFNHMNNTRFLREYDFGRIVHALRTRFFDDFVLKHGAAVVVAGISNRYRLPLKIFTPYKVVTTPVWWNEKHVYLDQRVISLRDGIVRAVAYTKMTASKNVEVYLQEAYPDLQKPPLPQDLEKWLESQEISRNNMRIHS